VFAVDYSAPFDGLQAFAISVSRLYMTSSGGCGCGCIWRGEVGTVPTGTIPTGSIPVWHYPTYAII